MRVSLVEGLSIGHVAGKDVGTKRGSQLHPKNTNPSCRDKEAISWEGKRPSRKSKTLTEDRIYLEEITRTGGGSKTELRKAI